MQKALTLRRTTVGMKAVMAITGIVLFGFLIGHLAGNLQILLGLLSPEQGAVALHEYAVGLRSIPFGGLWLVRGILLVCLLAHIAAAVSLSSRNADARPTDYKFKRKDQVTDYAARTMMWSGPIVAMYLLFHLLHLTFGYDMGAGQFDHQNPYDNLVYGFLDWRISTVYIVANVMVGFHLWHGCWSFFQSLGLNHARYNGMRRVLAMAIALFITIGNVGIPLVVMSGVIEPSNQQFCSPELAVEEGECAGFDNQ